MIQFSKTFAFGTETANVTLNFADLPEASQRFVIEYGLKQYLSDGAAVGKDEDLTDAERNVLKAEGVQDRVTKLLEGTMSVRGGGTRVTDPIAKIKRDLALEILKVHYKANDMKLPKGEELSAKIANFWERNGEKPQVAKELAKRIKAYEDLQSMGELDI